MSDQYEVRFSCLMGVQPTRIAASDADVVHAARVSTVGARAQALVDAEDHKGLINYLMRDRHGSPFEHNSMTWFVHAPIFVFREFHRHRIASYNEESGRYKQLEPLFYIPADDREVVQEGKPGAYRYIPGTKEAVELTQSVHKEVASFAYKGYQKLLNNSIAREIARISLPLNIYSSMYVTMNARALMNFLSLRVKSDDSAYPSYPQKEINMVANEMERDFADAMPITHAAFVKHGRVAP